MQLDLLGSAPETLLIIYCDGAAKGNPGDGGWGFVVLDEAGARIHEACGGAPRVTNNQMELTAMIRTLEWLEGRRAIVRTDSQYVQKGLTEWLPGWKRRGWRSSTGTAVKNTELWQTLDVLASAARAQVEWVRGHNGDAGNEWADA